jgi:hypothetical protein
MPAGLLRIQHKSIHNHKNTIWGGSGAVSGTVKIGAVAVRRRVRLYEASNGVLVRDIWSAADGGYVFTGLKLEYKYTVTATDFNGEYNDVIAANITPT